MNNLSLGRRGKLKDVQVFNRNIVPRYKVDMIYMRSMKGIAMTLLRSFVYDLLNGLEKPYTVDPSDDCLLISIGELKIESWDNGNTRLRAHSDELCKLIMYEIASDNKAWDGGQRQVSFYDPLKWTLPVK